MPSLFRFHRAPQRAPLLGTGLIFNGLLCFFFGLAILAAPDLLAFLVATFLILIGATLLITGWKIRQMKQGKW